MKVLDLKKILKTSINKDHETLNLDLLCLDEKNTEIQCFFSLSLKDKFIYEFNRDIELLGYDKDREIFSDLCENEDISEYFFKDYINQRPIKCFANFKKILSISSIESFHDSWSSVNLNTLYNLENIKFDYLKSLSKREKATKIGYRTIDELIGGLWPKTTWLIGAPSGHAKTTFMLNLFKKTAFDMKIKSLYIDLELGKERLLDKLLSIFTAFNIKKQADELPDHLKTKLQNVIKDINFDKFEILDESTRRFDMSDLKRVIEINVSLGVKVFFIDYIQKITCNSLDSTDKKTNLSYISDEIKYLANKNNVNIFLSSQLNRGSINCKLSDFNQDRISDAVELIHDRDFVINVRKFVTDEVDKKNILECSIVKNREGLTGNFYLKFKNYGIDLEECEDPNFPTKDMKIPDPPFPY